MDRERNTEKKYAFYSFVICFLNSNPAAGEKRTLRIDLRPARAPKRNVYPDHTSICSTYSAIANDDVRPGLSIPAKLTNPPWCSISKSRNGSPGPANLGLFTIIKQY